MFVVRIEEVVVVCVRKCCTNPIELGSGELTSYIYGQLEAAGQMGCFGMCLCESA